MSFSSWAVDTGLVPGQRTVEIARRAAGPLLAPHLHVDPGDPVVTLLRLRSLDGEPVMLERSAWIEDVGRHLLATDTDAGSTSAYLSALESTSSRPPTSSTPCRRMRPTPNCCPSRWANPSCANGVRRSTRWASCWSTPTDLALPGRANFVVHDRRTNQRHLSLLDPSRSGGVSLLLRAFPPHPAPES